MAELTVSEVLAWATAATGSRANSPLLAMVRHSPLVTDSPLATDRPFATQIFGMQSLIASGVRGGRREQALLGSGRRFRVLDQYRERL
ncbi:hypothetical protein CLAM6_18110 [Cobetia sp. AM6]|nr:hypothetical protein CLAM6_18110 [Cobetia sp. AM6]